MNAVSVIRLVPVGSTVTDGALNENRVLDLTKGLADDGVGYTPID